MSNLRVEKLQLQALLHKKALELSTFTQVLDSEIKDQIYIKFYTKKGLAKNTAKLAGRILMESRGG